jgi:putative acetyltransferase
MSQNQKIREFLESDLEQIYNIYFDKSVQPFMLFNPMSLSEFEKVWEGVLREKKVFVLEKNNKVLGFVGITMGVGMQSHIATISTYAVKPEKQGKGFGKKLLEFAIEKAMKKGATRITLYAETDNKKAIGFYKRMGFVEEGRIKRGMKRSTGYIDEIVMAKLI